MSNELPLIDMNFALGQLGNDPDIVRRLLGKFAQQYQTVTPPLGEQLDQAPQDARHFVHTLKGVSGNLGLKRLHQACVVTEQRVRGGEQPDLKAFQQALDDTLAAIAQLPEAGAGAPPSHQSPAEARARLLSLLQDNEFIPQQELDAMLSALDLDEAHCKQINEAIFELDYDQAIALVNEED